MHGTQGWLADGSVPGRHPLFWGKNGGVGVGSVAGGGGSEEVEGLEGGGGGWLL